MTASITQAWKSMEPQRPVAERRYLYSKSLPADRHGKTLQLKLPLRLRARAGRRRGRRFRLLPCEAGGLTIVLVVSLLLRGSRRIHDGGVVFGFLLSRRSRRSDDLGFLLARSEKRGAGQNAE